MELKAYSIYDSAAQAFIAPFFMQNDGLAVRAFSDNVNSNDENNISKHPDQFALYKIGVFNDKSGVIDPEEVPVKLMSGIECVNEKTYNASEIEEAFEKFLQDKNAKLEVVSK
jgi:hypothetical protein